MSRNDTTHGSFVCSVTEFVYDKNWYFNVVRVRTVNRSMESDMSTLGTQKVNAADRR